MDSINSQKLFTNPHFDEFLLRKNPYLVLLFISNTEGAANNHHNFVININIHEKYSLKILFYNFNLILIM